MQVASLDTRPVRRRITVLSVLLLIVLPALNYFGLKLVYTYYIEGNYAFGSLGDVIENLISFAGNIPVFVGYALIVYALISLRRGALRDCLIFVAVSVLIPDIAGVVILLVSVPAEAIAANLLYYLLYAGLDIVWKLFCVFAVLILCRRWLARNEGADISLGGAICARRHPVFGCFLRATVAFFLFGFLAAAAGTVIDIIDVGMPVNLTEVLYLLSPYLSLVVYSAVGYFVMLAVAMCIEGKHGGNAEDAEDAAS